MIRRSLQCFLAAAVVAWAALAQAHDTWLEAADGQPGRPLQLTSGTQFPALDYAIKPERVAKTWGRTGSGAVKLATPTRGEQALIFTSPPKPGLYAVQLAPKTLELSQDKVAEYLDEIHATPALRMRWLQTPEPRRWREQYIKHGKTLAAGGKDCAALFSQVLGLGLEIVPEVDPCLLAADGNLIVRLLQAGAAKAEVSVALVAEGGREVASHTTDADGRARFVVPHGGRWLLRAVDLRPSTRDGLDWQSDFTTFTFSNR